MQRPLVLGGFMATGKSSVARLVAERTGAPLIDLDARIEAAHGPIVEIFREHGEAWFREREREELERALGEPGAPVIAAGGGALVPREVRLSVLERAVVLTLDAGLDEVLRRAAAGPRRPLLAGDARAQARALLDSRRIAYAECHARIATEGRALEDVADQAVSIWRRDPIAVAADERSYTMEVGSGIAAERAAALTAAAPVRLLVTDANVAPLHAAPIVAALAAGGAVAQVVLQPGEQRKQIASVESIWDAALGAGLDRSGSVVALGGGVVTDVAGFAAATWMRGVAWVALPSTLLAMVDAALGGKTGVDRALAKNAVGALWQPSGVVADVGFVATEPERGYRSALAEVIKTALVGDADLLSLVERERQAVIARDVAVVGELVRRSARVKARIVSRDERERSGLRALLNLGHTLGHALEAHGGWGRLAHGEAVGLGLLAALRIGERLGVTRRGMGERVAALLGALGLPADLGAQPLSEAAALVAHDKKRAGSRLRFVVVREPGQAELVSLSLEELAEHARALR